MSEEKKNFVVKDRRIFAQDTQEAEEKKKEERGASSAAEEKKTRESQQTSAAGEQAEQLQFPEINFPTFVASLNASALVHLGVIEDPASGRKAKNLPMAKQTIDILSMLQEKTEGNLIKDEESMLKNILYDLRILYVKEKK